MTPDDHDETDELLRGLASADFDEFADAVEADLDAIDAAEERPNYAGLRLLPDGTVKLAWYLPDGGTWT